MIRFGEFQNSITGFESTIYMDDPDRDTYRVFYEFIPGVDVICTIHGSEIRDDLDLEGQLHRKAYEMFIKAIE